MNRSDILKKATECVCGQRQTDYGKAEDNFQTIADLWGVYKDVEFTAKDVAVMMALMKIARIKTGTGTADCFVDLAGYAACGGEIATGADEVFTVPFTDDERQTVDNAIKAINATIKKTGRVTVNELYDFLGKISVFSDTQRGWVSEINPKITGGAVGGYTLILPAPVKLAINNIYEEDNDNE